MKNSEFAFVSINQANKLATFWEYLEPHYIQSSWIEQI